MIDMFVNVDENVQHKRRFDDAVIISPTVIFYYDIVLRIMTLYCENYNIIVFYEIIVLYFVLYLYNKTYSIYLSN